MQNQKFKGKTTKIMLAIAAILLVMGLVCSMLLNKPKAEVAKETPIKVKVLGISENVVGDGTTTEGGEEIEEEGEEAESTEVTQIAGKETEKAAVVVSGKNYASKNHTIKLELDGTDNDKVQASNLTADNITVKVNGTALNPQPTKTLTGPTDFGDGKNGKKYELELKNVTGDGQLSITIAANTLTDEAGNPNAEMTSTFDTQVEIDNTAPTAPTVTNSSNGNWTNSNVTTTLASTDGGSGVEKYQIKWSGTSNQWQDTTASKTWSDQLNETIYFRAIDYVGNVSTEAQTNIKIDTSAPTLSLSLDPTGYAPAIDINVTSNDTNSSVVTTKWLAGEKTVADFASAGENISNNKFTVTSNNTYTVYVEDEAGNGAVSTIVVDKIDKTAPTIEGSDTFNGSSISFTVKDTAPDATETASGVVGYQITNSDTAPTSGWTNIAATTNQEITLSNTALTAGTHYIWVIDAAGNKQKKQIAVYYQLAFSAGDGITSQGTDKVTLTGNTLPNITPPTKTGYEFKGYYTAINGGGTQYYKADGKPAKGNDFTKDTILYAQWDITTYNVTFDLQGGTGVEDGTYTVISPTLTIPTPTKSGYTFIGWTGSNGDTPQTNLTIPQGSTGDKNYTANWRENSTASGINLPYTGSEQTGVTGNYVDWSGVTSATEPGTYTAYATPSEGYVWNDGTTSQRTITWYITIIDGIESTAAIDTSDTIYTNTSAKAVTVTGEPMGELSITTQPNASIATASISGTTLTVTGVAQGTTSLVLTEALGGYQKTINIVIDTTAPSSTEVVANIVSSNALTIAVNGGQDTGGSGIDYYLVRNPANGSVMKTNATGVLALTSNTGWYTLDYKIQIVDKVGNMSTAVDIDYYTVGTKVGLQGFGTAIANDGTFSGRIVKQTSDIDMESGTTAANTTSKDFAGTYDGQNYKITNFASTYQYAAFFYSNSGTLKNMVINTPSMSGNFAAGLVYNNAGTLYNCKVTGGTITAPAGAGGIANVNSGTITECQITSYVTIKATTGNNVGGIVCTNANSGIIEGCYASLPVFECTTSNSLGSVGGIVARNLGTVRSSDSGTRTYVNSMRVNNTASYIGGIAGNNSGTIDGGGIYSNTTNTQYISGGTSFGGIAGRNSGTISNCIAPCLLGKTTGQSGVAPYVNVTNMGRVVGDNYSSTAMITKCGGAPVSEGFNDFIVENCGGIAGKNAGTIDQCYNKTSLIPRDSTWLGGIAGYNTGTIQYCYNTGNVIIGIEQNNTGVTSDGYKGGIAGANDAGTIRYVYNANTTPDYPISGLGASTATGTYTYCYYLENSDYSGVKGTSQEEGYLKTLPGRTTTWENYLEIDVTNINNGYPILQWEADKITGGTADSNTLYYHRVNTNSTAGVSSGVASVGVTSGNTVYVYVPANSSRTYSIVVNTSERSVMVRYNSTTIFNGVGATNTTYTQDTTNGRSGVFYMNGWVTTLKSPSNTITAVKEIQ